MDSNPGHGVRVGIKVCVWEKQGMNMVCMGEGCWREEVHCACKYIVMQLCVLRSYSG